MISPDPPVHNCTLLYGTVRFMKKERFSRSFPTPFGQYNHISRKRHLQVSITIIYYQLVSFSIIMYHLTGRYEKKPPVSDPPLLFPQFNDITPNRYTLVHVTLRYSTIYKKRAFLTLFSTPFGQYNHISRTIGIQVLLYAFMCFYVLYFRKKSGNAGAGHKPYKNCGQFPVHSRFAS